MPTDQPTTPKQKLRWYQFSLRTLLIFVTVFACACSWLAVKMQQARLQKEAVEAITKLGGDARYDYERYCLNNERIEAPPVPTWLRTILGDDFFRTVIEISFDRVKITEADMKLLRRFIKLERLQMYQCNIADAGLENIVGCEELYSLDFRHTDITDDGLKHFNGLKQLKYLLLEDSQVTDAGVAELQKALPNCKIEH